MRDLTKTYGRRHTVLDGVSFDVGRGEIVGIVGANGAGKTTILHIVAGLLRPDRGAVTIDGRIGLCSSADRSFYYRLTMRDNLRFFGRLYGLGAGTLDERIEYALQLTELSGVADRRYSRCSTGMRQRLTIARALLADAENLLLDEPTRAVDPLHAEHLRAFIRDELANRRRKTILLATNLLTEAWTMCDRVLILAGGRTRLADMSHDPVPQTLFATEATG